MKKKEQVKRNLVFSDYATEFVATWRKKDGRPFEEATKRKNNEYLRHLLQAPFAGKKLVNISESDIYAWLDEPMGPTPRLRVFQLLKRIMLKAQQTGLIAQSPVTMRAPKLPKSKQAQIPVATREELETIYNAMPEYCRISVYLGSCFDLRINEVCTLQVRDFDLQNRLLHVRHSVGKGEGDKGFRSLKDTKTAASNATLPIPEGMVQMLEEQIAGREGEAMLIASPKTGGIMTDPALRRLFNRAAEQAGRPDLHFHTLRATAIDAATHQGATLRETMALGRHDDEKTSIERYQRASTDRLRELSNKVANSLLPQKRTHEEVEREIRKTKQRLQALEEELSQLQSGSSLT